MDENFNKISTIPQQSLLDSPNIDLFPVFAEKISFAKFGEPTKSDQNDL